VQGARPGDRVALGDVAIEVVPSYNIGKGFHPKSSEYLGFVVVMEGVRIYFAGDTDFIPEMKDIHADIVLLPVGGTYTMNVEEAVQAVQAIKPRIAVPMHWGSIVGSAGDAEQFKRDAGVEVVILEKE
jgi:L-ascorbate metabolism protein UlaG (beta-lactamase superfamily)